jgi:hypothetical protein
MYIPQGDLVPKKRVRWNNGVRQESWWKNGIQVKAPDGEKPQDSPTGRTTEEADVGRAMKLLRENFPNWRWDDAVLVKRLRDQMGDAFAATQAEDQIPLMRQSGDNPTHGPKFVREGNPDHEFLNDPQSWNKQQRL